MLPTSQAIAKIGSHWVPSNEFGAPPQTLNRRSASPEPRTSIAAKHQAMGANGACYICYESQPPPIQSGCACRDEAGFVHIECMVQVAVSQHRGNIAWFFFREAILMMELPRRHAASLERAAGSHPIRVQSMGGGRGRDRAQMTYSSSGLLSGSVWQMRRLWLAAHQTPLACASIPWYQSCLVCGKRQWGLEQGSLSKWCRDIRNNV